MKIVSDGTNVAINEQVDNARQRVFYFSGVC